ncbi:hypothetical protein GJ496_011053 [Pomphorhynchus laevis]|nr:hypothetical protein GJ496_011053 [Pomphorhynchus laevis]
MSRCPNADSTLSSTYDRTLNNDGNAARTVESNVNSTANDPKGPNTDRTDNLLIHANQVFPESELTDISTGQDIPCSHEDKDERGDDGYKMPRRAIRTHGYLKDYHRG